MRYEALQPDPWMKAKGWVIYSDGVPAELYVVDFPAGRAAAVAGTLDLLGSARWVTTEKDDSTLSLEEAGVKLAAGEARQVSLSLEAGGVLYQVALDRPESGSCAMSLIFHKDQAFPKGGGMPRHRQVFRSMVQLGLDLAEAAQARLLLLTPEWIEDPRKLEQPNMPGQILWKRPP